MFAKNCTRQIASVAFTQRTARRQFDASLDNENSNVSSDRRQLFCFRFCRADIATKTQFQYYLLNGT